MPNVLTKKVVLSLLKKNFSPKLERFVHEVYAGGFEVTGQRNVVFSALLGSCIAVCLKDRATGTSGMNHFMLPGKPRKGSAVSNRDARYGAYSMAMLVDAMLKIGANKNTLEAKIFGGGQVYEMALSNVAGANIDFIAAYLKTKNIPVLASNIGGRYGRKIYFFPENFDVYVKRINIKKILPAVKQQEKSFLQNRMP